MDFQSMNKTIMNKRVIQTKLDYKTIVFIIPRVVQKGLVRTEVRFPHTGKISSVYASCGVVGETQTVVDVEKCSEHDYNNTENWESILTDKLIIDGGKKSNTSTLVPYTFKTDVIEEGDHLRVNILTAGEKVEDITVEVLVEISTEFE